MADKKLDILQDPGARRAFQSHPRIWQSNRYVYPVVSRRSKGISIGVNLNPDKICNFDCIYCCVDRAKPGLYKNVDPAILAAELQHMLAASASGALFQHDPFDKIPAPLRRVNDIAFSGDGEPTSCPNFSEACRIAADCVEDHPPTTVAATAPEAIKLVVITNATLFHQSRVREALAFLDQHNGEIWAKLDAGTPEYYAQVDRTAVPFDRVLKNIQWCCQERPTVIQSLFMRVHGEAPGVNEIAAYVKRLAEIVAQGGRIKLVQIYTVARGTAEAYATPLAVGELEVIAQRVEEGIHGVRVEIYG